MIGGNNSAGSVHSGSGGELCENLNRIKCC